MCQKPLQKDKCVQCNEDAVAATLGEEFRSDPTICPSRNSLEQCAEAGGDWENDPDSTIPLDFARLLAWQPDSAQMSSTNTTPGTNMTPDKGYDGIHDGLRGRK